MTIFGESLTLYQRNCQEDILIVCSGVVYFHAMKEFPPWTLDSSWEIHTPNRRRAPYTDVKLAVRQLSTEPSAASRPALQGRFCFFDRTWQHGSGDQVDRAVRRDAEIMCKAWTHSSWHVSSFFVQPAACQQHSHFPTLQSILPVGLDENVVDQVLLQ